VGRRSLWSASWLDRRLRRRTELHVWHSRIFLSPLNMPPGAPRNPDNPLREAKTLLVPDRRNFVIYTSAIMAEADAYATKPSLKAGEDLSKSRERQVEVYRV